MIERRLTYSTLQLEVTKQSFRHMLLRGQGGPLVFLWSVGTGLFLFLLNSPELALVWTVAVIALGLGMMYFYLGDWKVRELLLRSIIERWSLSQKLSDASLLRDVEKGMEVFVEITLRIAEIEKVHGRDLDLHRVLASAYDMLLLQNESALQTEELDREENVAMGQEAALQAYFLVGEALVQLETVAMVLRPLQETKLSHDVILRTTELVREAEETLWKMRARVDSLRDGARVIPIPSPTAPSTPDRPVRPVSFDVVQRLADRYSPPELKQLRETIHNGLSRIQWENGLKALRGLVYEYAQLRSLLARRKGPDLLTVARIPALAEEAYRQGLSVLEDALELMRAISGPEREQLEAETAELEREIETLRKDETQAERLILLQEKLASNKERLNLIRQQRLRVDELLNQCGRCEASLDRTRIELAGLKADSSELSVGPVTQALRRTIDQAKEVQEELKKPGW